MANKRKKSIVDVPSAKSEEKELNEPKISNELLLSKIKTKLKHSFGSSNWQKKKLYKLSAEELKGKNMGWIPQGSMQAQEKDSLQAKKCKQSKGEEKH